MNKGDYCQSEFFCRWKDIGQVKTNIGLLESEMHIYYMMFLQTILYYENCVFLTFAPGDLSFEIGSWK